MKRIAIILSLAAIVLVAAVWSWIRESPVAPTPAAEIVHVSESKPAPAAPNAIEVPPAGTPRVEDRSTPVDPRTAGSPVAAELNAAGGDAAHDVEALHTLLRQYLRHLHQRQGRPIGNDSDLAYVLTGHNPMHLVVLPPNHPALSPDGRLRDRWGTPYFIHPRGNGAFEIRSAGPDRKLFTADDSVANPAPGRPDAPEAPPTGEAIEQ